MVRQIRKTTKKPPFRSRAVKYVETNSSSNAAAHDPEERVQLNKPKHYTIYKTEQEEKSKCKKKKNERRERLTDLK